MLFDIEAMYDCAALRPDEPLPLEAGTRARVTVEAIHPRPAPRSFFHAPLSLILGGPPEWSGRPEDYVQGGVDHWPGPLSPARPLPLRDSNS